MSVAGKTDQIEDPSGPLRFAIAVRYRTAIGEPMERTYELDLRYLLGLSQVGSPPLQKLARSIEEIQRDLGHLVSGFRRLQVIAYTKAEIEQENACLEAEFLERQRLQERPGTIEQADEADEAR